MEQITTSEVIDGKFKVVATFKKSISEESADGHFLGFIEGLASTPDLDRDTEIIAEKALLDAPQQLRDNDAVFFNHQHHELPLGKVVDTGYITGQGVYVKVGISKNHPNVWQAIEEGSLKSFSIAGEFKEWEMLQKEVDGKQQEIRVITKVDLYEVSVVGIPANPNAKFTPLIQKYFKNSASTAEPSVEIKTIKEGINMGNEDTEIQEPTDTEKALAEINARIETLSGTVEKSAELSNTTADLFNKFLEIQTKPPVTPVVEPKTIVPRDTAVRQDQIKPTVFKTAREYELYELGEFAKALLHPDAIKIDMYGTLKHTTPKGVERLFPE